jgi:dihydroneopterin triphosphate diphosphatase
VLVVIHTPNLEVLLLERQGRIGFWQSVTGSQHEGESLEQTAYREVAEETGLDASHYAVCDWRILNEYQIFPEWRWRYAPGVTRNLEHVFGLLVPEICPITISPQEHSGYRWLHYRDAASKCFSWSNRDAILLLPKITSLRSAVPS